MTFQDPAPNTSAVWIQLITTLGTILTIVVTQLLANKRGDRKAGEVKTELVERASELADRAAEIKHINVQQSATLGKVYSAVNGERDAARQRIAELEAENAALREKVQP